MTTESDRNSQTTSIPFVTEDPVAMGTYDDAVKQYGISFVLVMLLT